MILKNSITIQKSMTWDFPQEYLLPGCLSVGISEDKQQLARPTLPSLTYDCMKNGWKQYMII